VTAIYTAPQEADVQDIQYGLLQQKDQAYLFDVAWETSCMHQTEMFSTSGLQLQRLLLLAMTLIGVDLQYQIRGECGLCSAWRRQKTSYNYTCSHLSPPIIYTPINKPTAVEVCWRNVLVYNISLRQHIDLCATSRRRCTQIFGSTSYQWHVWRLVKVQFYLLHLHLALPLIGNLQWNFTKSFGATELLTSAQ